MASPDDREERAGGPREDKDELGHTATLPAAGDALGHTATLPASGGTPTLAAPERDGVGSAARGEVPPGKEDIESAAADLDELPVVQPDTYVFGHYFARGGMGRIAAVRDKRLGRVVAIKELIAREPSLIERFKREIQLTARLEHPAIVSIHEAGQWPTGEPFFVMRKVAGKSLKDAIAGRATLDERLGLLSSVIAIVDALAYAHQRGIIHRDLKPANVLVGEFGETVVIDWGLAKDVRAADDVDPIPSVAQAASAHVTVAGSLLGTPAYMAPEQARGETADERSDVYALGAILYTVLAGAAPYDGTTQADIVGKVLVEPPVPVGERQPGVPDDLQTIVARAMAREPAARYPSARELAADLKRFQTGQLVAAHKYSRGQLVARWLRRHRGSVLVGLAALGALIVLGTASLVKIIGERDRAIAAEASSSARADALVVSQARTSVDDDPRQAMRWLANLSTDSVQWPLARMVAADAAARGIPAPIAISADHADEVALSADGHWLALGGRDHGVRILDLASGEVRTLGTHRGEIADLGISPDGTQLVSASTDNSVRLWAARGGKPRTLTGHDGWVVGAGFSGDGKRVISTGLDRTTRLWPVGSVLEPIVLPMRIQAADYTADARWIAGLDANADTAAVWDASTGARALPIPSGVFALSRGGRLAYVENARTIVIRDVVAGTPAVTLDEVADPIAKLVFCPDGGVLVAGTRAGALYAIDVATQARSTYHADAEIRGIVMSADGARIAAWSKDGPVHLVEPIGPASRRPGAGEVTREGRALPGSQGPAWISADGARVITRDARRQLLAWDGGHAGAVTAASPSTRAIAASPDGTRVAFGGPQHAVRVWTVPRGDRGGEVVDLAGHNADVDAVAWSPNGALLASIAADKRVWLWHPVSRRGVALPGRALGMVVFSPDGTRLAAPGDDETIRTWDVTTGETRVLAGHRGWVAWVGYSSRGELASLGADGTVRVWRGDRSETVGTHDGIVRTGAFSRDGAWLASGGHDGVVHVWPRGGTGQPRTLSGHTGWVVAIAFDPVGRTLVTGGTDRSVRTWDLASGEGRVIGQHDGPVLDVAFSPDGSTIASASIDGTVRLFSLAAAQLPVQADRLGRGDGSAPEAIIVPAIEPFRILRGHTSWISALAFFPDGAHLATVGHDATARIWSDDLPRDPRQLRAWLVDAAR